MKLLLRSTLWWLLLCSSSFAADLTFLKQTVFPAQDTLAPIDESSQDARQCLEALVWPASDFRVRCEADPKQRSDALVRFPSPVPSGDETNDEVAMEWYVARGESLDPIHAPAIVVVHESGSGMTVGRLFARGLRHLGMHTFLIHLPYYGERREAEKPSAPDRLVHGTRQAIADVRRARDAVAALPQVDSNCIALQGTSLGGFVSATCAGLDRGYNAVFLVLAGGDLYEVIQNGKKDAAKARAELEAAGLAGEKLKTALRSIEPLHVAHRLEPSQTWLYSGTFDTVVPMKNAIALAKAADLDRSHHVRLPANHYSGIVYLPYIISHISQRVVALRQRNESRPASSQSN